MIPEPQQIGSVDLGTWRVVPSDKNPDKHDDGAWAIAAGDGEEHDLYLDVLSAEQPKEVAQFIVEAVTQHARRLRLDGAFGHIEQLRAQQHENSGLMDVSNPHLPGAVKLAHLVETIGDLAREVGIFVPQHERAAQRERLYAQLTHVAATTVAWMEATLSEHTPSCPASAGHRAAGQGR